MAADINSCGGNAFFKSVDVTDKAQVSFNGRFLKKIIGKSLVFDQIGEGGLLGMKKKQSFFSENVFFFQ